MEYVTLNNGIKMPKLGYGVYQTRRRTPGAVYWTPLKSATAASTPRRPTAMKKAWARRWPNAACPAKSSS